MTAGAGVACPLSAVSAVLLVSQAAKKLSVAALLLAHASLSSFALASLAAKPVFMVGIEIVDMGGVLACKRTPMSRSETRRRGGDD